MGFARFHLNGPKTSTEAVPVHTSGLGSDGVTVSPSRPGSGLRCPIYNCIYKGLSLTDRI